VCYKRETRTTRKPHKKIIFCIFEDHVQTLVVSRKENVFETHHIGVLDFSQKLEGRKGRVVNLTPKGKIKGVGAPTVISRQAVSEMPSPSFVFLNFLMATVLLCAPGNLGVALYTIP
jgi:hypothetical protein